MLGFGPVAVTVRRRALVFGVVLAVLTAVAAVASLAIGSTFVAPADVLRALAGEGPASLIVQDLRLPRVEVGLAVGALLGVSGALLQSVARNPLAGPDVMGVTQGAGLAATAVMTAGLGASWLGPAALLGGLA
ncbi:iron ABC transporter permease, partial [Actinomadura logoneensis]